MTPQSSATQNRTSRRAMGARVATLFDEHAGMVLGLCRLLLRDHHEAEDACQQTFVSAYRALLRGTEPREAAPWLAAIARNECRARLRKRARAPIALDGDLELELSDSQDLAEVADRRAELAALATEIAKLPSRQREAIALRDFLGLSYEEVASTLSVSVPVVESLLFRARRRLRDGVRRVPRYAAGLVIVPFALRIAVARDVPDFDSAAIGAGIAATAGAAAGGLAKLLSLPFGVKFAAGTAALVAAGSVVAPKLIHQPGQSLRGAVSAPAAKVSAEAAQHPAAPPAAAATDRAAPTGSSGSAATAAPASSTSERAAGDTGSPKSTTSGSSAPTRTAAATTPAFVPPAPPAAAPPADECAAGTPTAADDSCTDTTTDPGTQTGGGDSSSQPPPASGPADTSRMQGSGDGPPLLAPPPSHR